MIKKFLKLFQKEKKMIEENDNENIPMEKVLRLFDPSITRKNKKFSTEENKKYVIQGIIVGDIAGSKYEGVSLKNWEEPNTVDLFDNGHKFTDDTVLSIAVMKATEELIKSNAKNEKTAIQTYEKYLKEYTKLYPDAGYGGAYYAWVFDPEFPEGPYNSCGNGSAMRSGIIGAMFDEVEDVIFYSYCSAMPTHNHPEGIRGAIVTAVCVWMALHSASKEEIKNYFKTHYPYDNELKINSATTLKDLIETVNVWDKLSTVCQTTVPEAIIHFLESDSYESCIRNSMRYICDRDTVAAISGGIAIAHYAPNTNIQGKTSEEIMKIYLDERLLCDISTQQDRC